MKELTQLLTDSGFKLARQRKHLVWKDPGGRTWTVPATPSDKQSLQNNFSDLNNFLKRGKVTGSFGLTAVDDAERESFERTLHPTKPDPAKPMVFVFLLTARVKPVTLLLKDHLFFDERPRQGNRNQRKLRGR